MEYKSPGRTINSSSKLQAPLNKQQKPAIAYTNLGTIQAAEDKENEPKTMRRMIQKVNNENLQPKERM